MDKLQMCRICLAVNVRMYVMVNKTLNDLYEKLTETPFVTEDSRPILACFICCAQLKKCYRFQKKCLEAEEQFAQMMNEEYEQKPLNQDQFEFFHGFIRTTIDTINIVDVDQIESIVVKEELPAVCERLNDIIEPKEEHESDDDIKPVNIYDNYLDIEYIPPCNSEADIDDVSLKTVKTEVEDGKEVCERKKKVEKIKRTSVTKKSILDPRRTRLEDSITTDLKENEQTHLKVIRISQYRTTERGAYFKNPFKCNQRSLKRIKKLDEPTCSRIDEKPYKCDVCQRSFSRTNTLKNHIRVHTGEKPYKCDVCQHSFRAKNGLTRHIRVHTGEKPFNCHVCRRNFGDKGILLRHMRVHAGEKPFKCDACQRTFSTMYHLKRHCMIHTGEKRYQCDLCQRRFSTKRILIRHIGIHNGEKPFKCDECHRCFSHKGGLRNHIRIHTGEKPYKCDFCWRRFRNKSFLVRHIQKHTGGKPYKCDVCQHCFSHKGNLKNHIEEEHVAK